VVADRADTMKTVSIRGRRDPSMYEPCRCYTCVYCQQRRRDIWDMSTSVAHDETYCERIIPFVSNNALTNCLKNLLSRRDNTNYRLIRQIVTHLTRPIYHTEWRAALEHDNFIAYDILRTKESPEGADMRQLYYKYEHHENMIDVLNDIKYGPKSPAYREAKNNFQTIAASMCQDTK
jgi:hypothetical protein